MMVKIITPGGAGTYYMKKFLGEHYSVGRYSAHRRNPEIEGYDKVVYLYSNCYDTVLSYHRRGFLNTPYEHVKNIGGDLLKIFSQNHWTLKEYISNGIDFFNIDEHFYNWFFNDERKYDVMFLKYESLPQNIERLLDFYDLPKAWSEQFDFKPRTSDYTKVSRAIRRGLYKMYSDHQDFLDLLPNCFILRRNNEITTNPE